VRIKNRPISQLCSNWLNEKWLLWLPPFKISNFRPIVRLSLCWEKKHSCILVYRDRKLYFILSFHVCFSLSFFAFFHSLFPSSMFVSLCLSLCSFILSFHLPCLSLSISISVPLLSPSMYHSLCMFLSFYISGLSFSLCSFHDFVCRFFISLWFTYVNSVYYFSVFRFIFPSLLCFSSSKHVSLSVERTYNSHRRPIVIVSCQNLSQQLSGFNNKRDETEENLKLEELKKKEMKT
jgi:hypothetical protein